MKYLLKELKDGCLAETNLRDGINSHHPSNDPLFDKYHNLHDSDLFIEDKIS